MKLLFTIISILLIAGCRTTVDPAFNVSAQYINKLKSPVTLQLFSGGTMSKSIVLPSGEEYNLYIGSDSPPMLYDYDSVSIILSNHHYKTDLNCSKLPYRLYGCSLYQRYYKFI